MSSSANDLPIEILLRIFKLLPRYTLKEYQFVCKSWYQAARHLLLETVDISTSNTAQFSNYIKRNPSYRSYIKTVHIRLDWNFTQPVLLSPEEVCATVQANCPEVQAIHYSPSIGSAGMINLIYNLRNTIKEIEIDQHYKEQQFGRVVDFLAQFPHLKKVKLCHYGTSDRIQDCLQLLEKSPLVEDLHYEAFLPEHKLQIQPNSAPLNTLSNLKRFHVYLDGNMGSTTLNNFIKQYLTGLQNLSVEGWLDPDYGDDVPLMVDLMDIACAIKEFKINIKYLKDDIVREHLPSVMQKVYYQAPRKEKVVRRMLAVGTICEEEDDDQPPFNVIASCSEDDSGELTRSIELEYVLKRYNRGDFLDALNRCTAVRDLDILQFSINDEGPPSSAFKIFRNYLHDFDQVKKVVRMYLMKFSANDIRITTNQLQTLKYPHAHGMKIKNSN